MQHRGAGTGVKAVPAGLVHAVLEVPEGVLLPGEAGLQGPDARLSRPHLQGVVCSSGATHCTFQVINLQRSTDMVYLVATYLLDIVSNQN